MDNFKTLVSVVNSSGVQFDIPLELAEKFIQSGDIDGYTLDGVYIYGQRRIIPLEPKQNKTIIRKIL